MHFRTPHHRAMSNSFYLLLPAALLSCGTPCQTVTLQACEQTGTGSTTAPSRFIDPTCVPLATGWDASTISFAQWCSREASWSVEITLPYDGGVATYVLPSPDIHIYANFVTSTEYYGTGLLPPTLKVTSGTISVTTRNASNGEATVEIEFETTSSETFSVTGHVTYGNCKPDPQTTCES